MVFIAGKTVCLSALKWFVYHARRYTSARLLLASMLAVDWWAVACITWESSNCAAADWVTLSVTNYRSATDFLCIRQWLKQYSRCPCLVRILVRVCQFWRRPDLLCVFLIAETSLHGLQCWPVHASLVLHGLPLGCLTMCTLEQALFV